MNQKFRRDDDGREKSGGGVKESYAGLFADIGEMAEIPGDKIIDLVKRSERHMHGVGNKFPVKNPAGNITFGQDGDLFGKVEAVKIFNYLEVTGAVRFVDTFKLALDEDRAVNLILRQFVLEPADGQIAAKRIAIVQVRADDRCFKIQT